MLIVLNHKSNMLKDEYLEYINNLDTLKEENNVVLCPGYINIPNSDNIGKIKLGAQNVSAYKEGAHTGEVTANQLKSYGVEYVIVGHSERRYEEQEGPAVLTEKINRLIECNITPIYCVGETKEEKDEGLTTDIITKELEVIKNIGTNYQDNIIIAYEPIWAIGAGLTTIPEDIVDTIKLIKDICPNNIVLYGGSVSEDNAKDLKDTNVIDGYLIGGASLKPEKIKKLIENIK